MAWTQQDASAWRNLISFLDPATVAVDPKIALACATHLAEKAGKAMGRPAGRELSADELQQLRRVCGEVMG